MESAIGLLYVGCVLLLNGISMLQKFEAKSMAVMNFFTGGLYVVINTISLSAAVISKADVSAYYSVGTSMLFGFTYLFVGCTNWFGLDGRALAWYCFFVGITTVPCSINSFQGGDIRFGIIWLVWGYLWLLYWITGNFPKIKLHSKLVPVSTIITAIATCWIPGYMMLASWW
jgi:acid-activated urea channel